MRVLGAAMPVSRPAVATSRAELRPVPGLGREGRADQAAVKPCNPWQPDPAYAEPPRAPPAPGAGPQVLRARGVRVSAAPANASGGHLAMAAAPEFEMSRLATPPRAARDRRTTGRSPAGTSPGR